jgi:hypothetical protein
VRNLGQLWDLAVVFGVLSLSPMRLPGTRGKLSKFALRDVLSRDTGDIPYLRAWDCSPMNLQLRSR